MKAIVPCEGNIAIYFDNTSDHVPGVFVPAAAVVWLVAVAVVGISLLRK